MLCSHCSKDTKKQSIEYLQNYIASLHTMMFYKGLCKDLIDIVVSCLVNEHGHRVYHYTKTRYPDGSHGRLFYHYRVCSPCFQTGLSKYLNTHYTKISLPNMRHQKYFAKCTSIRRRECEKNARMFLLRYFTGDYKVDYYRTKQPTMNTVEGGKILYTIDYD